MIPTSVYKDDYYNPLSPIANTTLMLETLGTSSQIRIFQLGCKQIKDSETDQLKDTIINGFICQHYLYCSKNNYQRMKMKINLIRFR